MGSGKIHKVHRTMKTGTSLDRDNAVYREEIIQSKIAVEHFGVEMLQIVSQNCNTVYHVKTKTTRS